MSNLRTLPVGAKITHQNVVLTRKNFGTSFLTFPVNHQGDNTFNDEMAIDYTLTTNTPGGLNTKELLEVDTWVGSYRYHRPGNGALHDFFGQGGPVLGAKSVHNFLKTLDYWYAKNSVVTYAAYLWSSKAPTFSMIRSYYRTTTSNTIGTGSKTFFLPPNKTLTNQSVKVYLQGASGGTVYMLGDITAYNQATGETVINMTSFVNTGASALSAAATNWRVEIEVAKGARTTNAHDQSIIDYLYKLFGGEPSTTSNTIGLGAKTFTLPTYRLYTTDNYLRFTSDANPLNFMFGKVTAYDNATGVATIDVTQVGGSGTFADWTATIASINNRTLAGHPALSNIEISNESMDAAVGTQAQLDEYARVCRIVYKIVKKYLPNCTVTGDTCDQGRNAMAPYNMGNAVGTIAVEGDLGTGKQACDYLDGVGYNNYYFSNASFALHKQACELNLYPGQVRFGSAGVNNTALDVLTKLKTTSRWLGKNKRTIKVMIGEHSMVGGAGDLALLSTTNWSHGASSIEKAFWDIFRSFLPAVLETCDGNNDYGTVHFYAQDNAGAAGTSSNISLSSIVGNTAGNNEVSFTLGASPVPAFSVNLPEKRIVITAPPTGWLDLGLAANEKKRFPVRQISGDTVYIPNTTFTAKPSAGVSYTQFHSDWAPYPEDIKRIYDTFANVPLTFFEIWGETISDVPVAPATKRKYPGFGVVVPDIGTNSQYAGTYYIDGTEIGSKW